MATHKVKPEAATALMQAGFELGYDAAIALVDRIAVGCDTEDDSVAWVARELRKMREAVVAARSKTIAEIVARKGGVPQ